LIFAHSLAMENASYPTRFLCLVQKRSLTLLLALLFLGITVPVYIGLCASLCPVYPMNYFWVGMHMIFSGFLWNLIFTYEKTNRKNFSVFCHYLFHQVILLSSHFYTDSSVFNGYSVLKHQESSYLHGYIFFGLVIFWFSHLFNQILDFSNVGYLLLKNFR
jgi:hypothetical protein